MTMKLFGKVGRYALWLLPVAAVAGALAAIPWLTQQNAAVASALAVAAAIIVMGYVTFVTYRRQRRLDEVQIASQGFAATHGWANAAGITVLLLMLPPVMNWLVNLANTLSTGSPDLSDRGAVRLAFIFGVCLVVAMQALGVCIAAAIWWRRMGGMGERT